MPGVAATKRPKAGDIWSDRAFRAVALVAGLLVLIILGLIAYTTTSKAWPAFREQGFSFVTSDRWNPNVGQFGALAFIFGTLVSSAIAIAFAVPLILFNDLVTTE